MYISQVYSKIIKKKVYIDPIYNVAKKEHLDLVYTRQKASYMSATHKVYLGLVCTNQKAS